MRKIPWFVGLISAVMVTFVLQGCASLPLSPPGTRPVITHAFLPKEKGRYGDTLKIYLEAGDPKGYLFKIFTAVDQVGYGSYSPDTIYVDQQSQHHLLGYLE